MKKIMGTLAAAVLAVSMLAGCNGNTESNTKKIAYADDLTTAKIAVQEGTTGDMLVSEDYPDATISRFKSALDAGMDLSNGKVDAVVLDELPAKKIVEKNDKLVILPEELTKEEYAIAIKKGNTELVEKVNKALADMKADGTFDEISNAWINGDEAAQAKLAEKEEPTGAETLIMGTNASFPPFETRDDAGNVVGFDVEMTKEIARRLGMAFQVEDMNFDSLPVAVDSGKITMAVAGMTVTEERKENMEFSDGYYTSTQVIITQK